MLFTDDLELLITDYTETFRNRNGAEFESFYESDYRRPETVDNRYTETFRTRNGAEFESFYESDYRRPETVDNRLH